MRDILPSVQTELRDFRPLANHTSEWSVNCKDIGAKWQATP